MSFPRYPEYKDSGVEWLGKVPRHWDISALKRVAYLQSGESITSERIDTEGQYPVFGGNGLRGYTDSFTHEGHYALIGRQGALCGNINYAKGQFWASEHAVVATPVRSISTVWLGELMRSMDLNQYSVSAAQPGLSVEIVSNLRIPVPPLSEQNAIAAFLGHETAKIEGLMAEQEKLIALLKEKRQAVIAHAVTKGLDPTVPMKDSGVEWLGVVPAHWGVGALGYLATIDTGATPDRGTPVYWNGSIPWVKTGEINWQPILETEESITEAALVSSAVKVSPPGTLLMAMYGQGVTRGRVAMLEISSAYNQACAAISFGPEVIAQFGLYFFMAAYQYVRDGGNETSQMNLSSGLIAKIKLPIPPRGEQSLIVKFLSEHISAYDNLVEEAQHAIDLLKERRTALISAAVTGQIDVRGLVKEEQEQAA